MTFTPNIPVSGQSLGETRDPIRNNFTYISTTLAKNHFPTNDANAGKHQKVEMPVGSLPTGVASEGILYTKTATGSQLYYTPDASGNEYQMTRTIAAKYSTFSTNSVYDATQPDNQGGWTFLPGGMLLQYGFLTNPQNNDIIPFAVSFTTFAFVTLGATRNSTDDKMISVKAGSVLNNQFQVILSGSSPPTGLYWQAVGK